MDKQQGIAQGNYILYFVISHHGKEHEKEYIHIYNRITLLCSGSEYNLVNQVLKTLSHLAKCEFQINSEYHFSVRMPQILYHI